MHVAQKFEHLLDTYRRADVHRWTGAQLDEAIGSVVTRSYVTNLRKGRIENPGYEKLAAMAKAMGFPPEVWFEEGLGEGRSIGHPEQSRGLAGRLEHLFEVVRNPKTGKPYTNAEVARLTLGDLSEEEVERIRTGAISDPTVGQVVAYVVPADIVAPEDQDIRSLSDVISFRFSRAWTTANLYEALRQKASHDLSPTFITRWQISPG